MTITRRKWYNVKQALPAPLEEVHVWGITTGSHISWRSGENWICRPHDIFDTKGITHFHRFPDPDRIK